MYEINSQKVTELESTLRQLLGLELAKVIEMISNRDKSEFIIEIPDGQSMNLTLEDIASLVARTSNAFVHLSYNAGVAKADAKLAKGRYERKFKSTRIGSSESERVANAMRSCLDEHMDMTNTEAIADIAEALEAGARIASESSRKLLDKLQNMIIGQQRETHGSYKESDFSPY